MTKELNIPKKEMEGVKIVYTGAEKFPNAYKYTPESTHFTATYHGGFWRLERVYRDKCPNRNSNICIVMTENAKEAIIRRVGQMKV